MKNFTIIIPIFNESDSIFRLVDEITKEFKKIKPQLIIVNDGSTDDFLKKKDQIRYKPFKLITHTHNCGKCKAMYSGIKSAKNKNICIIDGDGQNPPYEAKKLMKYWNKLSKKQKKFGLICGNRINRQDTIIKRASSKVANKIRRFILNDECNDTACALKVFSRDDYLKLDYFLNMHRFLPALFKMNSGEIHNVSVTDRKRERGVSKYSFNNRFWIGVSDLIKVRLMILKRRKI